ncbi:dihydropteroate synthase [soil metagenome]
MGILNVTPDSFSDGGRYCDLEAAVAHARRLIAEGANVVDVGGESTRPGAAPVDAATERARVVPVIAAVAPHVRVSVDTSKAAVAEAAIEAGATLLNDVSASLHDVAAAHGVGWVAMHMQGEPRTMQQAPRYADVVADVLAFLRARGEAAVAAGVGEVWIDPGIGFGKTAEHNLCLLAHLDRLVASGFPVLVGTSRKAFLGRLLAGDEGTVGVDDRLEGSLATAVWAMAWGAAMVRVHDVRPTVEAARVVAAPAQPRAA